jgi:FkbM family methyltransferase
MLRGLIESLSRGVVLKRRLPEQFNRGALFVSPDSALKYWRFDLAKVDQTLLDVALEHVRVGDTIWDIGANVGLFTFAAANLAGSGGSVLCIEADIWLCNLLSRSKSLKSNVHLNIDVLPVAISDSIDILKFNIASRGRSANFLAKFQGSSQAGGFRETRLVPSLNLDYIVDRYKAPQFIKIDVEGAEALVLKGAQKLLTEIRPVIYCEVSSENVDQVSSILHDHKYKMFDSEAKKTERTPLKRAVWNTLAYPES